MEFMLKWRYNRLKQLVKLCVYGKITSEECIEEYENIRNEIYILETFE